MAREQKVTKLSKSILEMKFMKRTKEKVEKELEDAEGREMYSHEITAEMIEGAGSFVIEQSFVACEDLLVGRLSYRGMNPEIERLMELENAEKNYLLEKRKEADVSDAEMAAFYNPLVKTMDNKFNKRSYDHMQKSSNFQGKHKRSHSPVSNGSKIPKLESFPGDSPSGFHKNKKTRFAKPSDD